jgi:hypothetical protein
MRRAQLKARTGRLFKGCCCVMAVAERLFSPIKLKLDLDDD